MVAAAMTSSTTARIRIHCWRRSCASTSILQNAANPYDIPSDNPFVGNANFRGEIWAMGLRNPFRFSFDRQTGQLWVGDVGQNQYEEIDIVTKGMNYGWPAFEGNHAYLNVPLATGTTYVPPVFEYDHSQGIAIIGGYVYRGSQFTSLFGRYVYADNGSGTVWAIDASGQPTTRHSRRTVTRPRSGRITTASCMSSIKEATYFEFRMAGPVASRVVVADRIVYRTWRI